MLALAGLPHPLVNAIVRDRQGAFVGRVDLLFAEYGVIVEYDGAQHGDDAGQWRTDITRINDLQALGYLVIRVHKDDMHHPEALVRRIRRALLQRGLR
jgi:very-short-patch-repair endonuclease